MGISKGAHLWDTPRWEYGATDAWALGAVLYELTAPINEAWEANEAPSLRDAHSPFEYAHQALLRARARAR
jgi:hypothetical protein